PSSSAKVKKIGAAARGLVVTYSGNCAVFGKTIELNMAGPLGLRDGHDFDRIGADHGDDLDGGAGGQGFLPGDCQVFYRAVLELHGDFAGAAAVSGDGQVHRAGLSDGAVNEHVAVGLVEGVRLHD